MQYEEEPGNHNLLPLLMKGGLIITRLLSSLFTTFQKIQQTGNTPI